MGAAIGVAIAYGLKASPLCVFSNAAVGATAYAAGGPVGAYLASIVATEVGTFITGKTKVDIVVVPFVTILGWRRHRRIGGPRGIRSYDRAWVPLSTPLPR